MKNYIINYTARDRKGNVLKAGKMRVKNKANKFMAQVKFEEYLKRKHPNFGQLVVHDCREDNPFNELFGGIFGEDNPLGL